VAIHPVPEPVSVDPVPAVGGSPPARPTLAPVPSTRALPPEENALDRTFEWVREAVSTVRDRVRSTAEHYPLQLIVGLGAAAFLGGVALRIWRSNRYARNQNFFRKWRA
jgi:hypothetical protein